MQFRRKAAGVVEGPLGEGGLNLLADCELAAGVAGGPFKFTVTSPYMLARTLLDRHYGGFERLLMGIADVLAAQVRGLPCACLQVDEANIPGNPADGAIAAKAINRVLDAFDGTAGGASLLRELRRADDSEGRMEGAHGVSECAARGSSGSGNGAPAGDRIWRRCGRWIRGFGSGIGVVDVKINHVETADEIARRIECAEKRLGQGRVGWVHPDCGFWMLKRSVADRKIAALVKGRDLYLGRR